MKVSIDSILGSARRLNTQKNPGEDASDRKKTAIVGDSVSISSKIATRLDSIQRELKDVQSSLTRNQIIDNGIQQLRDDLSRGSQNAARIFEDVRFENKRILHDYVGESVTGEILNAKQDRLNSLVSGDIATLRRLQIESENILASDLAQPAAVDSILGNINSVFSDRNLKSVERSSHLNADAVMRLIT